VIGGGLLGTATCYWLARAGVRVALLEREGLASGASGRNGGFVRIWTHFISDSVVHGAYPCKIEAKQLMHRLLAQPSTHLFLGERLSMIFAGGQMLRIILANNPASSFKDRVAIVLPIPQLSMIPGASRRD
jgi:hypothetical protein